MLLNLNNAIPLSINNVTAPRHTQLFMLLNLNNGIPLYLLTKLKLVLRIANSDLFLGY